MTKDAEFLETLNAMLAEGRKIRVSKGRKRAMIGAGALGIGGPVAAMLSGGQVDGQTLAALGLGGAAVGGAGGWGMGFGIKPAVESEMERLLVDTLMREAGVQFVDTARNELEVKIAREAELFPVFDDGHFRHLLRGHGHWSFGAELIKEWEEEERQADGTFETKTEKETVFEGRYHCVPAPQHFDGTIFVLPRGQRIDLPKVSFSNPDFMDRWSVYADDGTMAHYMIDGPMSERLVDLSTEGAIEALVFLEQRLHFLVSGKPKISFRRTARTYDEACLDRIRGRIGEGASLWQRLWPDEDFAEACARPLRD